MGLPLLGLADAIFFVAMDRSLFTLATEHRGTALLEMHFINIQGFLLQIKDIIGNEDSLWSQVQTIT